MIGQTASARSLTDVPFFGLGTVLRHPAQAALVLALLVALVGLPVAVDVRTTPETLYRANSTDAQARSVTLEQSVMLVPALGLMLDRAHVTTMSAAAPADTRARRLVLNEPRLVADFSRNTRATSTAPEKPNGLPLRLASGDYDSLLLRNAHLVVETGNATRLTLDEVNAEVTATSAGTWSIDGKASINGQRVHLTGRWSADERQSKRLPKPISFEIRSNLIDARFEGQFADDGTPSLHGHTVVKVRKLRLLARMLGIDLAPSKDLHKGSITGDLDWANGVLSFARATVEVDGNSATGALTLKTGKPRPVVEGTLGFQAFDAGRYVSSLMAVGEDGPAEARNDPRRKYVPLLSAFDADLRLSAAKVVAPNVELGRAAMTVALRNGNLMADLAELEIEGGQARGQVTVEAGADTAKVSVRGKLVDVDPARIFSQTLKRTPLFARANLSIEASGTGPHLTTVLSNMAGRCTFTLTPGGKLNLDLKTLMVAAQGSQIVGWSAAGKGTTSLDRVEGRFAFANSGITLEALNAQSGSVTWSGRGKIDIAERLLDVVLTAPLTGSETAGVQDALAIRGNWFDPAISRLRQTMTPSIITGTSAPATTASQPRN